MIPFAAELSIAGVVLLGAVSPGPDFFVLTRRTAVSGRGAGLMCAAGMATGIFLWVTAVGDGVGALLAASPVVFTVVKSGRGRLPGLARNPRVAVGMPRQPRPDAGDRGRPAAFR